MADARRCPQLLTTITVARGQPLLQNQELVLSALMSHSVPCLGRVGGTGRPSLSRRLCAGFSIGAAEQVSRL